MALRDRWNSRTAFIFAVAASLAGLGSLWRFPYLVSKFGGGAFLLPYLLILLLFGIPLLMLELSFGQKLQKGVIDSFRGINKGFGGVGLYAVIISFVVVSYYAVVMSWSLVYLFNSFTLSWGDNTQSFFFKNILQISNSITNIGGINETLLIASLGVWLITFLCIRKGVKSISRAVLFTFPVAIILLLILFVRGLTLPGAIQGIMQLIKPDFSLLISKELWIAALSQVFFSLSLAFGVLVTYSSFNDKKEDITANSLWIAGISAIVSILVAFTVFGISGFMASQGSEAGIESGPALVFLALPKILSLMPAAEFFAAAFFLMLLFFGISSMFSFVANITAVFHDSSERKLNKTKIAFTVCLLGFLLGLIFITNGGLYYLDLIDHFITNFGLVLVGLIACILIGWVFGAEKLREYINSTSKLQVSKIWNFLIKYLAPLALGFLLVIQFLEEIKAPYEGYPFWAIIIGIGVVVVPILFALWFSFKFQKEVHLES